MPKSPRAVTSDDLCIDCHVDLARYCQSCMAEHVQTNIALDKLNSRLFDALEALMFKIGDERAKAFNDAPALLRECRGEEK